MAWMAFSELPLLEWVREVWRAMFHKAKLVVESSAILMRSSLRGPSRNSDERGMQPGSG